MCEHGAVHDLVQRAERAGTRIIRFQFCDYSGIVHAKAVHVSILERKLSEGIGSTLAQTALNVRDELIDIAEMPPVGEVRIVPDPATYSELPWAPGVAAVMCDLVDRERAPWFACARSFLRRQVEAAASMGIDVSAAFELEFYLCRPTDDGGLEALPRRPVYSTIGLDDTQPAMSAIVDALVARASPWRASRTSTAPASTSCRSPRRIRWRRPTPRSRCETPCAARRSPTATGPASPPSRSSTRSEAAPTCTCRCGGRAETCCTIPKSREG
jgi:glutamine synthetase